LILETGGIKSRRTKIILTSILIMLLSACAAPSYREKSGSSSGYSETQLGENIFRISYVGMTSETEERTADFAWLRGAELTLKNGYQYFRILDDNTQLKTKTRIQPSTYSIYGSYLFQYGGVVDSSTTPTTSITILMSNEQHEDQVVYSADFLVREIRSKYEMNSIEN
jgi:hypothetical protein